MTGKSLALGLYGVLNSLFVCFLVDAQMPISQAFAATAVANAVMAVAYPLIWLGGLSAMPLPNPRLHARLQSPRLQVGVIIAAGVLLIALV